ncbi:YceI family protein [Lentisalinibacter salinarum]|uniref:YceI family protein n=1 Tax=Lentisalinibacter salinarum TaxID=2992239 RepID=UPI00386DFE24
MRRTTFITAAALLAAGAPAGAADLTQVPSGSYHEDDQHAYVIFSYTHLGFSSPKVRFDDFDVTLKLDTEDPEASEIDVSIDVSSVDSGVEIFDGHLMGAEYFDLENHPAITFESTSVEKTGENTYDISGGLTVKGKTVPVTLAATINGAGEHPLKKVPAVGISATGTVLRSAWGLDQYVPAVSDEVTLTIEVELIHGGAQ